MTKVANVRCKACETVFPNDGSNCPTCKPGTLKTRTIRGTDTDNLMVSEDIDMDNKPLAVLLYTPTMFDTDKHYHIELNREEVTKLHEWLGQFLAK